MDPDNIPGGVDEVYRMQRVRHLLLPEGGALAGLSTLLLKCVWTESLVTRVKFGVGRTVCVSETQPLPVFTVFSFLISSGFTWDLQH